MKYLLFLCFCTLPNITNSFAQCDTVYHHKKGLRLTIYYPRTLDARVDTTDLGIENELEQFKKAQIEVDRITLDNCSTMADFDRLLLKLKNAFEKYQNEKALGAKRHEKKWLSITVQYSSPITLKDLIAALNRLNLNGNRFDVNTVSNEVVLSLRL